MNNIIGLSGIKVACRPNSADGDIAAEVILRDDYNIRNIALPGEVFVDLGAYGGHASLLAASLGMKCIAIEPLLENVKNINDNIRLNGFENLISVVHGAVGTDRLFWNDPDEKIVRHRFVANSSGSPNAVQVVVPMLDLDSFLPDKIRLLKTDCEGGEWALINSKKACQAEFIAGEFHTIDNRTFQDFVSSFPHHRDVSTDNSQRGLRLFILFKSS